MARRPQAPNMDTFDAYFRRADLDQDGRISGAEAVAFFQGSNLPQHILAQIWMHADQNRTGFLGRPEFYNALKLVTVAQSGRELTSDIVKAALFGPAAAKIPPPQINPVPSPAPQMNAVAPPAAAPQLNVLAPSAPQTLGFRGPQVLPNAGASRQNFLSSDNQFMRPPQGTHATPSLPIQGINQGITAGSSVGGTWAPNSNSDWLGGRAGAPSNVVNPQVVSRGAGAFLTVNGAGQAAPTVPAKLPQDGILSPKDSKSVVVSGNGFTSESIFGGDVFSASPSQPKQDVASAPPLSTSASNLVASTGHQSSLKPGQLDNMFSNFTMPSGSGQLQQVPSLVKQNQVDTRLSTSAMPATNLSVGVVGSASAQSQIPWPSITKSDIQKYTAVFVEVDKDRDGKITGEEARNLFLSWRLPREILKQVWDLADQDNDSMLSMKEFCTALYLMERYREGRPLPSVLPNNIGLDEALLPAAGQPTATFGDASWQPTPGLSKQGIPGSQTILPTIGRQIPTQIHTDAQTDGSMQSVQPKSKVPVLEKHLVNQLSKEEQSALNSKFQEATEAEKKVEELEKEILDSREKIEFYRTKMQELVLYKSRCDNRLNEITERASGNKREVESLAKKYEEKYKTAGDLASKLTVEEATFRDIQERKLELYNAIVKMEQGGSADGLLQVRADRIQSDIEELVKALSERCKGYGLRAKPTSLVELPFGWQPGIQEGAADWDEDWDKFDDIGFMVVQELTIDGPRIVNNTKPNKSSIPSDEKSSTDEGFAAPSSSNLDEKKVEKPSTGSSYAQSEDEPATSPPGSPPTRSGLGSPPQEFGPDASSDAKENQSDHGGGESTYSGQKFDEAPWGANFTDANDDNDSVWGFSNTINTKDSEHDKGGQSSFFGSNGFGLDPIRTDSPNAESIFAKKGPFAMDSVPTSPLFNSTSPPRYSGGSEEHSFDMFTRFDSFSMHDSGVFPRHEPLTRFDSIRSTNDHGHGGTFARFDSIRSTNDHGHGGTFARFDSIRSTSDQGRGGFPSFDDADPFGSSSLFKTTESQTPRRGSDNWSAF